MCTSAWTCIASARRSPSSTTPAPSGATATSPTTRRAGADPGRPPAGHPGRVRGRLRLGVAGRPTRRTRARTAPGPPQPLQGDRLGPLEERQGRRAHLGPAAARRPATRGLDRSPAGPRPARPAVPSGMAWPRGHRGQGSRARGAGRPRRPVEQRLWTTAGRAWLAGLALPAVSRAVIDDCVVLIDQLSPLVARLERDLLARAAPDP